ncbi:MAG: hypothetical protein JRI96_07835 [Deltaproteobacteria bacterium]|nr:hypothetical protein [Deltaproteobacteria bacterium]
MEKLLESFSIKSIQESAVLIRHLRKNGFGVEGFLHFMENGGAKYLIRRKINQVKQAALKEKEARNWWPPPRRSRERKAWLKTLTDDQRAFYKAWRKVMLAETEYGFRKP